MSAIRREIGYIIERALRLERRVVNLGPLISSRIPAIRGCSIPPMGARVAWRGAGLAIRRGVEDRGARVGIEWTGVYRIDGDAFTYLDPTEGSMMVMGYPTREIEAAASSIMR